MNNKKIYVAIIFILALTVLLSCTESGSDFKFEEATISDIHNAYKDGSLTCVQLVQYYLNNIEKYDKSTGLNSIVVVNPLALEEAERLDTEFRIVKKLRPLHGIPFIIKDNFDTKDLQTAGGSLALKGSIPPDDAFQVRKIRDAGALILAKSNMAEWAFSPYVSESSILGVTRNPYDLERVPAGSSGGTAAAVAANFGTIGLGSDTGNSIRGPSSHNALVGIRSTIGLTSRDGIIPLYLRNDIGGPMGRTVEDVVRVFEIIAGYDPADPITEECLDLIQNYYVPFLDEDGLQGARIGVFRTLFDVESADKEILVLMEKAIEDLKNLGAEIIDPFEIPNYRQLQRGLWQNTFKYDLENYLASLGEDAPFKTLQEIVDSGKYSEYIKGRLEQGLRTEFDEPPKVAVKDDPRRLALLEAVVGIMDELNIDAFIYPSWNNPPRKVGDMESPHGNNSPYIPPHTGQPAITVPMGFTTTGLPAGLQMVARPYDEPILFKFAYAYEQATKHRKPPVNFPVIK
ncbi:amidase [candidate division KSB1 bacterium]